jgi:hypothetical protein
VSACARQMQQKTLMRTARAGTLAKDPSNRAAGLDLYSRATGAPSIIDLRI